MATIIYQDRKWHVAEKPEQESIFRQVGTCFIGPEKTPEHSDVVFMDCSNRGWLKDLGSKGLGVVRNSWGSYAAVGKLGPSLEQAQAEYDNDGDWNKLKTVLKI